MPPPVNADIKRAVRQPLKSLGYRSERHSGRNKACAEQLLLHGLRYLRLAVAGRRAVADPLALDDGFALTGRLAVRVVGRFAARVAGRAALLRNVFFLAGREALAG